jgi:hypothetical protein
MAWNKDEEGCIYVFPVQQADGNWIKWEDYAKLKAEVERLTKAGGAMADWLDEQGNYGGLTDAWNAAKEGKS